MSGSPTPLSGSTPSTPEPEADLPELDRLTLSQSGGHTTPLREATPVTEELGELAEEAEAATGGGKEKQGSRSAEDEELERFRAQWREEVKARRGTGVAAGVRDRTGAGSGPGAGAGPATGSKLRPAARSGKDKADVPVQDPASTSTNGADSGQTEAISSDEAGGPAVATDQRPAVDASGNNDAIKTDSTSATTSTGTNRSPTSPKKLLRPAVPSRATEADPTWEGESLKPVASSSSAALPRPARFLGSTTAASAAGSVQERAVQLYAKAVECEQAGKLNDALMLYRKAFKLDDDVDRLYARSSRATATPTTISTQKAAVSSEPIQPPTPTSADIISSAAPTDEPYSFARHIQMQPDYVKHAPPDLPASTPTTGVSPLTLMLRGLPVPPQELRFMPAEETLPTPIAKLPAELLDPILSHLDVTSIERFGSTCWRARYLTHVSLAWRRIAEKLYKPPAMLPSSELRDLARRHGGEWRTTVVEEERVRMDGCYIAICHYIRPGAGDEWVAITHMITYHRFLRFYPDGYVISYLTTDHPSEIVPVLRPSIRGKGLHFGRWKLVRSDSPAHPVNLNRLNGELVKPIGQKGSRDARVIVTDLLEPGNASPKYEFEMELGLKSTGRGRWNKLEIIEYRSINLLTGEVLALTLKHQKPFYFSKVRSYNPPL
ncbi:hypothetical protein IAU60_003864 [Kwoniella sp. DSM 27419]